MTTDIIVRTNGNYIAEGTLTVTRDGAMFEQPEEVKVSGVGSNEPVEKRIFIPHNSQVSLQLTERQATPEEVEAAKAANT